MQHYAALPFSEQDYDSAVGFSSDYRAELNRGSLAGPAARDVELAHELVRDSRLATLSTLALHPAGFPYGSLVAHTADDAGRPLFLLSALAEHTKNLGACDRASLLVVEDGATNIVTAPRVTVVGTCRRVSDDDFDTLRTRYVAAHPESATWFADHLHDYALYRLEPVELRLIVGFGRLSWISANEYAEAAPKR